MSVQKSIETKQMPPQMAPPLTESTDRQASPNASMGYRYKSIVEKHQVSANELHSIVTTMQAQSKATREDKRFEVKATSEAELPFHIKVASRQQSTNKGKFLDAIIPIGQKLQFDVTLFSGGNETPVKVKAWREEDGKCWLQLRGSPSDLWSLLKPGVPFGIERHQDARVEAGLSSLALRRIMQADNPAFDWAEDTRGMMLSGAYMVCPVVVEFFKPIGSLIAEQELLQFLRALYSLAYGDGQGKYRKVTDDLAIRVSGEPRKGVLPSVRVDCFKSGRIAFTADISAGPAEAGSVKNLRVVVTLRDKGLRELMMEADIGTERDVELNARNFTAAVDKLNKGDGDWGLKFTDWLWHHIVLERMGLWCLQKFTPSLVDTARKELGPDEEVLAVFDEWRENGFQYGNADGKSVSFDIFAVDYARKRITRAKTRKARMTLMSLGLDLNLPLASYYACYNLRFYWNLSLDNRQELAVALERGDKDTVDRLQRQSAAVSGEEASMLQQLVSDLFDPAEPKESTVH